MISIRRAVNADAETIADFQVSMAMETEDLALDRPILLDGINALLADPKKGYYYLILVYDRPVGSLMITFERSDWRNGNIWWIQSVFIEGTFRGQGLFRKMYESIKSEVMADPEVRALRLYVFKDNKKAKAVYKSIGMTGDHYEIFEWTK